jgi:hypothetical protein
LRNSKDLEVLRPLLKLSKIAFPDNLVALHHNVNASTPEVTRYCGETTVDGCKMAFEFKISDTSWRPGEKGFELLIKSVMPPVVLTTYATGTELNYGEDPVQIMPSIQFPLLRKADDQIQVQEVPYSSSRSE